MNFKCFVSFIILRNLTSFLKTEPHCVENFKFYEKSIYDVTVTPHLKTLGVNFINVFVRFFVRMSFFIVTFWLWRQNFVRKMGAQNVDEIDGWSQFHQHFTLGESLRQCQSPNNTWCQFHQRFLRAFLYKCHFL